MKAGMRVSDNLKFSLNESLDDIKESCDSNEIRYKIIYNDTSSENSKQETVVEIPEYNIILQLDNYKVVRIKSRCSEHNMIVSYKEKDVSAARIIQTVTSKVVKMVEAESIQLEIESINLTTMHCVFNVKADDDSLHIGVIRDGQGNIFISSLRFNR